VNLSAGVHRVRVQFNEGLINFNYFDLTPGAPPEQPAQQSILVDGTLSDWGSAVDNSVGNLVVGAGPVDSAFFEYRLTEHGVFVAVRVQDNALVVHDGTHQSDSVELYLNGDNIVQGDPGAPSWAQPGMGADEMQFAICADGTGARAYKSGSFVPIPSEVQMASAVHADHYAVEFFVPWTLLNTSLAAVEFSGLGLDIGINDADAGPARDRQIMWHGTADNWRDPHQWGSVP